MTLLIRHLADLERLAVLLAEGVAPGEVWTLDGDLGAGKTTLVQCLCRVLGLTEAVTSPTFVLVNEYRTHVSAEGALLKHVPPILHGDFYRLGEEKADTLMSELLPALEDGNSLVLMEWATLSQAIQPFVTLALHLTHSDQEGERRITLTSSHPHWQNRLNQIAASFEEVSAL